jgi:hypothetical protein
MAGDDRGTAQQGCAAASVVAGEDLRDEQHREAADAEGDSGRARQGDAVFAEQGAEAEQADGHQGEIQHRREAGADEFGAPEQQSVGQGDHQQGDRGDPRDVGFADAEISAAQA